MLASAAAFTLPPVIDPPMMMTSFTSGNNGWVFGDRERDVGERTDGNQRDFVRRGVDEFDDEVGAEARVDFALARRQVRYWPGHSCRATSRP